MDAFGSVSGNPDTLMGETSAPKKKEKSEALELKDS